jgi:hypothetical protein
MQRVVPRLGMMRVRWEIVSTGHVHIDDWQIVMAPFRVVKVVSVAKDGGSELVVKAVDLANLSLPARPARITDEFAEFADPPSLVADSFFSLSSEEITALMQTNVMSAFHALKLPPGGERNRALTFALMLARTGACDGLEADVVRRRLDQTLTKGSVPNQYVMHLLRSAECSGGDASELRSLLEAACAALVEQLPGFTLKVDLLTKIIDKVALGKQALGVCFAAVVTTLTSAKMALALEPDRLKHMLKSLSAVLTSLIAAEAAGASRDATVLAELLAKVCDSLWELRDLAACDALDSSARGELSKRIDALSALFFDKGKPPMWFCDAQPEDGTGGRALFVALRDLLDRWIVELPMPSFDSIEISVPHPMAAVVSQRALLGTQMFVEQGGAWEVILRQFAPRLNAVGVFEMRRLLSGAGTCDAASADVVGMLDKLQSVGPFVVRFDMRRDFLFNFGVLVTEADTSGFVTMMGERTLKPVGHVALITGAGPATVPPKISGASAPRETIIFQLTNTQDGRHIQYVSLELLRSLNADVQCVKEQVFSVQRGGSECVCAHLYPTMSFGSFYLPHDVVSQRNEGPFRY